MDQVYVCPQCGEESDAQGPCPMCGLPMVPAQDESDDDLSFREEEKVGLIADEESLEEEEEDAATYNPYEE